MSEEIFDVVDEADRVIGAAPRSEVHRRGLRHRAVHVLVCDARGRIFLQKRSMRKDMHPGTWDSSASGHLERGEDYDACALRELQEEIGLSPSEAPQRVLRLSAQPETGEEFVWVYFCKGEEPLTLNRDEISEGAWLLPAAIDAAIEKTPEEYAPAFRLIWQTLRAQKKL